MISSAPGHKLVGIEIKRTSAPKVTRSMHIALGDLNLDELIIVHAGKESHRLASRVRTVAAGRLHQDLGL